MSSKPDKERENIEGTTKDMPGQPRQPIQQGNQPGQQPRKEDQPGQQNRGGEQKGGQR